MEFIKWWERVYTQLFADNAALVGGIIALLLALLFVSLVGYLTLLCVHIVKGVRRRRLARAEIARKLQFTLPDRENSYVRSRLNTVLKPCLEEEATLPIVDGEERGIGEESLQLGHARKLLCRVREAALSPADRLQTDEMSKTLSVYLRKTRFAAEDLRVLNDMLSMLLKMSAKYEV